jgi:hypothetical protein
MTWRAAKPSASERIGPPRRVEETVAEQQRWNLQRLVRDRSPADYLRKLAHRVPIDRRRGPADPIGGREADLSQQEGPSAPRGAHYKQDPVSLEVMGAKSIEDVITRCQFMRVIAEQDAN